jgi:hypothetical protein
MEEANRGAFAICSRDADRWQDALTGMARKRLLIAERKGSTSDRRPEGK